MNIKPEYVIKNEVLEDFPSTIAVMGSDNPRIMIRKNGDGLYIFDISKLKKFISQKVETYNIGNNAAMVTKILNHLKTQCYVNEKEYFSHENWIIPFKIGYYDVRNDKFEPIINKSFFYEIPHHYKQSFKGDCPKFKQALIDWLFGQFENPTKPDDLFEIMGYLMTMNVNLKKAFYIYGDLNSGKTTFENILLHIIGEDNRANISLQRMTENQFGTNGLQLKILDMVGDHGSEELIHFGIFKELTGGDREIAVEGKGKNKGKFLNHCKLLLCGNGLPLLRNPNDEAYYFRWILINFANSFPVTIEPFSEGIINDDDEVQGIIHECVKGVVRLYKRGHFRKEITQNLRHYWLYNSNPLYRFVKDKTIYERGEGILCEDFKKKFQRYVVENKLGVIIPQDKITKELEAMLVYRKYSQVDGVRKDRYEDIRFLTKVEIKTNGVFDEHYDLQEEKEEKERSKNRFIKELEPPEEENGNGYKIEEKSEYEEAHNRYEKRHGGNLNGM